MKVRVLGCSGAIAKDCRTTSFLIDGRILFDAGTGVGDLSLDEMQAVDDVFLTHSHLDHIAALPLMLDAVASITKRHHNFVLAHVDGAQLPRLNGAIIGADPVALKSGDRIALAGAEMEFVQG